jgi:uncharacterized protein YodC (DUF2158 family)
MSGIQFKPGDVVRSTIEEGPPMTVREVEGGLVAVDWFDEQDCLHHGVWNAYWLELAGTKH